MRAFAASLVFALLVGLALWILTEPAVIRALGGLD